MTSSEELTREQRNGWTLATLAIHLEALIRERHEQYLIRFDAIERETQAATLAAEKASDRAELTLQKRFESVNEMRGMVTDILGTALPRDEYAAAHAMMLDKYENLKSRIDGIDGRGSGRDSMWGYVAAAIGLLIGTAGVVVALVRG